MTTVLVVDDTAADRTLAGGLLGNATDWEIAYATNGAEALEAIEAALPDLVLTDLQMPELDGLELVTAVRADYPTLPVVLMTAAGSEEIAVRALQEGAASYVPKSLLAKDLVPTLERILAGIGLKAQRDRLADRIMSTESYYVIENDLGLVSTLVNHLQEGVGRRESMTVASALDEALRNAYFHGNLELSPALRDSDEETLRILERERLADATYGDRRIHVTAAVTPDEARYVVRDEGPGFDPSTLPDPTEAANLDRPYGRGLLLMRTFMDEVTFNDAGNQVTMVKRRRLEG